MLFCVLFVCICVLYYCHGVATQLQLNISYHISYHIIFGRTSHFSGSNGPGPSYKLHRVSCGTEWHQISTRPNGSWIQFAIKFSWSGSHIRWFEQTGVSDWCRLHRQGSDTIQYTALPCYIVHLPQQCHNSKLVIFREKNLKALKCYNFLWVQRRHNCYPAASFANCVMTLCLLKVHLQTFLSILITQKC